MQREFQALLLQGQGELLLQLQLQRKEWEVLGAAS